MRPRTQKQPQVKKELCRVLDDVSNVKRIVRCRVELGNSVELNSGLTKINPIGGQSGI